jgi:hypothetical protein
MKLQWSHLITAGVLSATFVLGIGGCKKDNPADPGDQNPQELITTVILILDHPTNRHEVRAVWRDLDGPGGVPPTIDTLKLEPGVTYTGEILLLNELEVPPDTVSHEVEDEADVHLFVYTVGGALGGSSPLMTVTITDVDVNNRPVGLTYNAAINAAAAGLAGTLRVELRHFQSPAAKGTGTVFETDIDVTFPVLIE